MACRHKMYRGGWPGPWMPACAGIAEDFGPLKFNPKAHTPIFPCMDDLADLFHHARYLLAKVIAWAGL